MLVSRAAGRCAGSRVCSLLLAPRTAAAAAQALRSGLRSRRGGGHWRCCAGGASTKHRLVFLGTPDVAAQVLQELLDAAAAPDSSFEVAAVVSQPGRPRGRGNKRTPQPSPVEALALAAGVPADRILCPVKASEADFLARLRSLAPDLCVTAAYGNILPTAFLQLPRHGTLNIHPSLLPRYRGAAPVQRALQDGCAETGVSVAFTVRAMDAGPVLAQHREAVDSEVQAPELLARLFRRGTALLLEQLPAVWAGEAQQRAQPQDEAAVTHAAKLSREEGVLDFRESAVSLHNKVRAFAGWPGTTACIVLRGLDGGEEAQTLKVLRTSVAPPVPAESHPGQPRLLLDREGLRVLCGSRPDAGVLQLLEVQPPNKRPMAAAAFANGLNGRTVHLA